MSIRDELAKLLAQHENPGFDTWGDEHGRHTVWSCICGWQEKQDGWDATAANQHLADVILAHYAVVERPDIPTPTEEGVRGQKLWYLSGVTVSAAHGEVWTRQSFRNRGAGGARTLAAVLIEAADYAEAADVDR